MSGVDDCLEPVHLKANQHRVAEIQLNRDKAGDQ